jgi:prepilin-type N-terminal cleavage/methylation domain-containing protein
MASELCDVSSPPPVLCQRNGFTLIEILTAIVIMAIIAALAIPRLNLEGYKVGSAVRGITAGLSYAQRLAVSLQSDVRVSFDSTTRRLQVHEDTDNDGVVDPGERVTYTNLEEGVTFGRGAASPITYSDGTTGNGTFNFTGTQNGLPGIVFRRDGSASENGGFYLNTIKAMVRGQTNAVRAAEIVRSSGKVIWYSYSSGAWTRGN